MKWLNVSVIQMWNVLSACTSLGVPVYWLIFGDKTLLVLPLHSKGASSAHLLIFELDIDVSLPGLEVVLHCRQKSVSYLQGMVGSYPLFACVLLFCTRCGNCCVFLSNTHTAVVDMKWVLKHNVKMAVLSFSSSPGLWMMQCWELVVSTLRDLCRWISGWVDMFLKSILKLYMFCVCVVG